jgi:PPP family 3-phenylpropionic acid transporter
MDGLAFAQLGRREAAGRPTSYQSVRLWGSIGWMLPGFGFALLSLPTIAGLAEPTRITSIALWLAVGLCGIGLIAARGLPNRKPHAPAEQPGEKTKPRPGSATPLPTIAALRVLGRQPMLSFAIATFALFMGISVYYAFYPQYVEKTGVPARYIGLITNIGVLAEILIVLVSAALLKRIGIKGVMMLGAACSMIRLGMLAISDSPWVAIGSQVFHGPMVLALHFVPPAYFNRHAGPAFRNSMQGLYVMLCFGVARLIGSAVGGYCVDLGGADTMAGLQLAFAAGAVMCLIATLWMGLGFREQRIDAARA